LPETFLSVPNRLCFTGHTKGKIHSQLIRRQTPLVQAEIKPLLQTARSVLSVTRIQVRRDAGTIPKEMKFCFARVSALVLIVKLPHPKTMNHDNGNLSSLDAAVARPES